MAKLYFRYGTVGSAKTMNLLAVAHNYTQQEKRVLLIKPKVDTRFGVDIIKSRTGLFKTADLLVGDDTQLTFDIFEGIDCVLVDEAQFIAPHIVDFLHELAISKNVPVICYGLRTDFKTRFFAGSQRLMELADSIEEVKTTCFYCDRKAVFNMKLLNGVPTTEGPQIDLGAEEKYLPVCKSCYSTKVNPGALRHEQFFRQSRLSD